VHPTHSDGPTGDFRRDGGRPTKGLGLAALAALVCLAIGITGLIRQLVDSPRAGRERTPPSERIGIRPPAGKRRERPPRVRERPPRQRKRRAGEADAPPARTVVEPPPAPAPPAKRLWNPVPPKPLGPPAPPPQHVPAPPSRKLPPRPPAGDEFGFEQ
jgi:hypothetical protein